MYGESGALIDDGDDEINSVLGLDSNFQSVPKSQLALLYLALV
jgi:hypothetical protein